MISLFPPALILYTDNLPEGVGGCANGPVIRIRPKYREDEGIHAHELTHVWQWWLTLGLHSLLYLLVRRYRLWAEVQAYREQTRHPPGLLWTDAATRLTAPRYRLGLTQVEAEHAILNLA